MLIDTHCHINFPDKFPEPAQTIDEARAAGVEVLIAVGCDLESSRAALALSDAHPEVYAVVGWHPNYTAEYCSGDLPMLAEMLEHPKAVAVGEIGLDFHWKYATLEQQERALVDQLALASDQEIPVVFHCREAYPELLTILEAQPGNAYPRHCHSYLFHCFSGNCDDAERAIALDAYFGVDGPITYPKADDLRETVRLLPRDRIVIETDSPYLTPMPFRGKPNQPAYVKYVNAGLAALLEATVEECAALTTANAKRFFCV